MSVNTDTRQEEIESQNAAACPVVRAIDQIGTPWRLNVIHALTDGEKRFNDIKRATGARSKTLSDTLDELVDQGIVTRRMEEDSPVAVYYGLTVKGEALLNALSDLEDWANEWVGDDLADAESPSPTQPNT